MSHAHHPSHTHDHPHAGRPSLSLMRLSVPARMVGVCILLVVLWLAVMAVMQ